MSVKFKSVDRLKSSPFIILEESGLTIKILGGLANFKNDTLVIPPVTIQLVANSTNYIYINWSTGSIESNESGFIQDGIDLWSISTDTTKVVAINDYRSVLRVTVHTDHITMQTENKNHNANNWLSIGRAMVDFSRYRPNTKVHLLCMAKKEGGGTGVIRVYDYLGSQELISLNISESGWTVKKIELSIVPSSEAALDLQIKTDGVGVIYCGGAAVEVL